MISGRQAGKAGTNDRDVDFESDLQPGDSLELLFECVPELDGRAGRIASALLPGPYTLVLPNPARRFAWPIASSAART